MARYLSVTGDTRQDIIYDLQDGSLITGRPSGTLHWKKKDYRVYSAEALLVELEAHDNAPIIVWPMDIPYYLNPEVIE